MAQARPFWLIRKSDLRVLRPISENDLIVMIESGKLKPQDEICQASGYWFSLQDAEEVRQHLGDVKLNSMSAKGVEVTSSTDTDPLPKTKLIQPQVTPVSSVPHQSAVNQVRSTPRVSLYHDQKEEPQDHKRALFFVIAGFLVFLFLLISIWSGTH